MDNENGMNIPVNEDFPFENKSSENNEAENFPEENRKAEQKNPDNEGFGQRQNNPYQGNSYQNNPYQDNPYQNNPYQGNPYQNNPYQNNPYQGNPWNGYYGSPYQPPVKKPSLLKRITEFFVQDKYLELSVSAIGVGLALVLQRFFDFLFGTVIGLVPALNKLYFGSYLFQDLVGMVYSLVCVGLPFVLALVFFRKASDIKIPFGAPKKKSGLIFLIPAGMGIFYVGNLVSNYIVTILSSVGIELYSYETAMAMGSDLPKNIFEFIIMATGTALVPALVEEFAFRGVMMQSLRRYGDWFAIIMSAVFFGLIHGNLMQIPFAIVAGIALGYVAVVTNSIWVAVILHFMNNFLSLIYSFIGEMLAEGKAMVFSALFTYGIIFLGAVALAGYAYFNPRFMRLYPAEIKNAKPLKCAGVYFVSPAVVIFLIAILSAVVQDIKL